MPIYEYRCQKCKSRFSELVRNWITVNKPACPKCGAHDVERVMSTFAYHRSVKDIQQDAGEPSIVSNPDFYSDPRNIGRWTEKKFEEMGMDMPGDIREEIDAARDGMLPDALTED